MARLRVRRLGRPPELEVAERTDRFLIVALSVVIYLFEYHPGRVDAHAEALVALLRKWGLLELDSGGVRARSPRLAVPAADWTVKVQAVSSGTGAVRTVRLE